ncbi:helix-turn-helix domain-containing protein [Sunxiuqinia sp. sy24]|uniref:helix-turn-helix domain-containing protein n=1 Tax=Sunxiuqinia sp. sy24 TaxID=3461495 RepID=UPI0040452E06
MGNIETQLQELKNLILQQNLLQKEVLTLSEAAKYLGISKPTLYKLTSEHRISFYKPMGKVYFKRSELEEWIFSNKQSSNDELDAKITDFITSKSYRA